MHQEIEINDYIEAAIQTESDYANTEIFAVNRENQRIIHAVMGMCTETGELQNIVKRSMFYGKAFDVENFKEELGDLAWYFAIACSALKVDPRHILAANIAKLKKRFPNKFSAKDALNRDLNAEKDALGNGNSCWENGGSDF